MNTIMSHLSVEMPCKTKVQLQNINFSELLFQVLLGVAAATGTPQHHYLVYTNPWLGSLSPQPILYNHHSPTQNQLYQLSNDYIPNTYAGKKPCLFTGLHS